MMNQISTPRGDSGLCSLPLWSAAVTVYTVQVFTALQVRISVRLKDLVKKPGYEQKKAKAFNVMFRCWRARRCCSRPLAIREQVTQK